MKPDKVLQPLFAIEMGRQREPIASGNRFLCVVFGKPKSVQTFQGVSVAKASKYAEWRDEVARQVRDAIASQTRKRGYEHIIGRVAVRLIWYSPSIDDPTDPDVDNIGKPYIDALKGPGGLILDDKQIVDFRASKVDLDGDASGMPGAEAARESAAFEKSGEFVLVQLFLADDVTSAAEPSWWEDE